jgi:hypothetical protein
MRASSMDVKRYYADRIEGLEGRNVLRWDGSGNWPDVIRNAKTWREVQIAQSRHDAMFHPDVVGLPRADQLRHYHLHLSKLVRRMLPTCFSVEAWAEFAESRLIDLVIFGVKLATVTNVSLPDIVSDELE